MNIDSFVDFILFKLLWFIEIKNCNNLDVVLNVMCDVVSGEEGGVCYVFVDILYDFVGKIGIV